MNKYILAAVIITAPIALAHAQYYIPSPPPIIPPIQIPQFVPTPSTVQPFTPPFNPQPLSIPQYSPPTTSYTNCAGVGAYLNCTTR